MNSQQDRTSEKQPLNIIGRNVSVYLLVLLAFCNKSHIAAAFQPPRSPNSPNDESANSESLQEFLKRFDPIADRGFVKTLRTGSTGIGYTLETLLKIKENNSPRGDLLGMEIKAYRDSEIRFDDHSKMNLFLKEPEWLDEKTSAQRISDYGYIDDNGRRAWYQSVTVKRNSSGLSLKVNRDSEDVVFLRRRKQIGRWSFATLQKRLTEKLSETVFVAAETRGTGRDEEFHFQTVTYCAEPSVEQLLKLIEAGDVIVELRMHIKPTGSARNHGTAFRVRKHRLRDLFGVQRLCRPLPAERQSRSESKER